MKKIVSLTLALLFSVFCFGCNNNNNYISARYFNTDVYVQVNGDTLSNDTKSQITSFLSSLEKEFALTDSNSAISRFNQSATTSVNLSNDGVIILEKAIACYTAFDKKFNPALYPLSVLWQFSPNYPVKNFTPPSTEELNSISPLTLDFDNVVLDKAQKTLSKLNDNVKIDLGGIAKGYASQKVGEMLKEKGYKVVCFSGGFKNATVPFAKRLGLDAEFSNILHSKDGCLTGHVGGEMMFSDSKGQILKRLQALLGISREQTMTVGDGANDLSMFKYADTRVSFCGKPVLEKEANILIKTKDLNQIFDYI